MSKLLFLCFIAFSSLFIASCYNDNEETLYPEFNNDCDTTNVTYSLTISKTINDYCKTCHGANYQTDGGGLRLDNYSSLKQNINDVLDAINHRGQVSKMPKNSSKLNDCKLKQFDIWVNNGMPNN